jgi:dihydroorotate dehydrogenase
VDHPSLKPWEVVPEATAGTRGVAMVGKVVEVALITVGGMEGVKSAVERVMRGSKVICLLKLTPS